MLVVVCCFLRAGGVEGPVRGMLVTVLVSRSIDLRGMADPTFGIGRAA